MYALQVLEMDNVLKKFRGVIAQLEQALCDFPYDKLDISDEVREQVTIIVLLKKNYFRLWLSTCIQEILNQNHSAG